MKRILPTLIILVLMLVYSQAQNTSPNSEQNYTSDPVLNDFVLNCDFKTFEASQKETTTFTSQEINLVY